MDLFKGLEAVREPGDDTVAHLVLLDLAPGDRVGARLRQLASMVAAAPERDLDLALQALLASPNWRGHVLAAAGLFLHAPGDEVLDALWSRITLGTWVVGPLAAAACHRDPRFAGRAKGWIEAHFGPPELPRGGIDGIWNVFYGQTVAVLLAFVARQPGESTWVAEWQTRPTVVAALAEAGEAGAKALRWWAEMSRESAAAVPSPRG